MMYDARQARLYKVWVPVRKPASVRTGANDRRFKATWCSPAMHDMNQAQWLSRESDTMGD